MSSGRDQIEAKSNKQRRASATTELQFVKPILALMLLLGLVGGGPSSPLGQLAHCQEQLASNFVEAHTPIKAAEDLDTLKYLEKLEKLDKYWSEVARPRFGRSEYKQPRLDNRRQLVVLARHQPQQPPRLSNESPLAELLLQSAMQQRQQQFGDAY